MKDYSRFYRLRSFSYENSEENENPCPYCSGTGEGCCEDEKCFHCNGTGEVPQEQEDLEWIL